MMYWSAFVIGMIGSLHCIGMCGPIVLVLPGSVADRWRFLGGRLLYNIGRAITYAILGLAIGLVGQSVAVAGYQQWLGIIAGALMILSVLLPTRLGRKLLPTAPMDRALAAVKSRLGRMLGNSSQSSLFTIGLLNGLLPCGLVYMALAASVAAAGNMLGSALYMFVFGLGTLPVMFATAYASNFITVGLRRRITKYLPVGVVVLGLLFILRGLSLGIPFLSPDMDMMLKKGSMQKQEMRVEDAASPGCCGSSEGE